VEFATAKWMHWRNQKRLHGAIGDMPPAEFETLYYRQQQAVAAA
jgi:putative transposase